VRRGTQTRGLTCHSSLPHGGVLPAQMITVYPLLMFIIRFQLFRSAARAAPFNNPWVAAGSISFAPPHVRPTGRAWGDADHIKKIAHTYRLHNVLPGLLALQHVLRQQPVAQPLPRPRPQPLLHPLRRPRGESTIYLKTKFDFQNKSLINQCPLFSKKLVKFFAG